jgi:hypothetical protein
MDARVKRCGACNAPLTDGRRDYCNARCKRDAAYTRERLLKGTKTPRKRRLATTLPEGVRNGPKNSTETVGCEGAFAGSNYRFEQVNDVTWKLTHGQLTNVPASHGQWPGFRTTKAFGWVINVGWPTNSSAWLARYRDQTCGPMSLAEAKAAAKAVVRGAVGDYTISDPLGHLNGLTARLIDKETA